MKKTIILLILVLLLSGCISDNGLKTGVYKSAELPDTLTLRDDGTFIDTGDFSYGGLYQISAGYLTLHYEAMGLVAQYKIINSTAYIGYKNYTFVRS